MRRATLRLAFALPFACAAAACWPSDPSISVYALSPIGVGAHSYAQVGGGCWWKDALGGGNAMLTECMGKTFHLVSFKSSDPAIVALSSTSGRIDALATGTSVLRARVRTFGDEVRHASTTVETRVVDGVSLHLLHGDDTLSCDGLVQRGVDLQVASSFTAAGEKIYGDIDPARLIASDVATVVTAQTVSLADGGRFALRAVDVVTAGLITAPTDPSVSVPVATYDTGSVTSISLGGFGGQVFVSDLLVGASRSCDDDVTRHIAVTTTDTCLLYAPSQYVAALDVTGPAIFQVLQMATSGTCSFDVSAPSLGLSTSHSYVIGG